MKLIVNDNPYIMMAPWLDEYTFQEEKWIERFASLFNISPIVDPVGYDQCLALMYLDLPWLIRILFSCEIKHVYYKP